MSEEQRKKLMWDNPMVTSRCFELRCHIFVEEIMKPVSEVKDCQYRFDWQWRGSPHIHGFLWLNEAPEFDEAALNDESIEHLRVYFDKLCSAEFVKSADSPANPSRKRFGEP